MSKKYKVILVSGGFDPVHKGHIECIQNARALADKVWIGLNNDSWLRRKKGKSFMKEDERAFIMDNIKGVDWVYIMNPKIHMVVIELQVEFPQLKMMYVKDMESIWFGD